jgi:tRNA pseudouridine38-40 synthase
MREAARAFVGMRDFRSFAATDDESTWRAPDGPANRGERQTKSTLVLVDRLDIVEDGPLVLVAIHGSHFLWKMVRRIVGVLVEIGRGALEPAAAREYLEVSSAAPARLTAPPSGLFLERVVYRGDEAVSEPRAITPLR